MSKQKSIILYTLDVLLFIAWCVMLPYSMGLFTYGGAPNMLIFMGALACIAGMWLIGKMLSTGGRRVLVQVKYCVIISLVLLRGSWAYTSVSVCRDLAPSGECGCLSRRFYA